MEGLFKVSIVLLLFLGANVLYFLGIGTGGGVLSSIHVANYLIVIVFLCKEFSLKNRKLEWILLAFILFMYLTLRSKGNFVDTGYIINTLISPILLVSILANYNINQLTSIKKIVLTFFIIECTIAIMERVVEINFFPLSYVEFDSSGKGFRSNGLQDHPLQNALCVSVIMSFLLLSDVKKKYILWGLGFLSLLCFNARAAIIVSLLMFGLFIIKSVFSKNMKFREKFTLIFLSVTGAIIMIGLMINFGWGGRLLEMGVMDESSASVRIRNLLIFDSYSFNELLWGMSAYDLEMAMESAGMENMIMENYWIVFIFRFGVIFTLVLVILFALLFKKAFRGYSPFYTFFVTATFILISSTNNSLAVSTPIISIFVICCYIFRNNLVLKNE